MKKTTLLGVVFFVVTYLYPMMSYAILVEDPIEWAKTGLVYGKAIDQYNELVSQFNKLKDLYQNAKERLDKATKLVNDSEGHYKWGDFANSEQDLQKNRQWSPASWDDALKNQMTGGNPQRYQQLVTQYKQNHPATLKSEDYQKGASATNNKVYQQQVNVNQAATVNASYAFNDIKDHLQKLHDLSQQIEKTTNTKSALDLLARIVTEQSYISVQELKMQTLMNQQLASQQSTTIAAETTSAKFNSIPDK